MERVRGRNGGEGDREYAENKRRKKTGVKVKIFENDKAVLALILHCQRSNVQVSEANSI